MQVAVHLTVFQWHSSGICHFTLTEKLAMLDIYQTNCLVSFFSGHSQYYCINYDGMKSTFQIITASVIQESGIGPAASS